MVDVVVIGGGTAGLSAALVLGRARRSVLVLDSGEPRNAPAAGAHGLFTRDGTDPHELLRIGRKQLAPYASVSLLPEPATSIAGADGGFEVTLSSGETVSARKILLAYGLTDTLPEIEGLERFWGKSVLHCPYCHGWEVKDRPLAYVGDGAMAEELGALILGWSRNLVLCTNGATDLTWEQRRRLKMNGVEIKEQRILRVDGEESNLASIHFEDGEVLPREALFIHPVVRPRTEFSNELGCDHTETGLIAVDMLGHTSVAGVYAAGDLVTPFQQVVRAAATGATAAAGINHTLATEEFAARAERSSSEIGA